MSLEMKAEELRIKPSELRLGNWVMYDNRYFQISMIADVFPELNTTEFGIGVVDYNNISATPLSEEVLLKCGFKLNKEKTLFEHAKCGLRLMDIVGLYYRANFPIKADVTSIHQLQNLYYALTGEELEIQL